MSTAKFQQFLASTADAMPYVKAHGFLTAIAQTPTIVLPTEWQSLLLGPTTVTADTKQAEAIGDLVMNLHNEILIQLNAGEQLELPCPDPAAHREWAAGYLLATQRDHVWREDPLGVELLLPFGVLTGDIELDGAPEGAIERIIAELPEHLLKIHAHWIEWRRVNMPAKKNAQQHKQPIGRNEPCPCDSGLKYKRCCGRVAS